MRGGDEMTDEHAVRLLRPLRGEPEEPSRIDVPRAMTEGRKRRALRRWSGGVALIALTSVTAGGGTLAMSALRDEAPLPAPTTAVSVTPSVAAAVPAVPAGPSGCEVARLPTDGVKKALVTAGDPSGRYLAGRVYQSSVSTIIWKDGKIFARPRMTGGDPSYEDINTSGVAVGSAFIGERQQAYVFRDGRVTALDGQRTRANAINEAGVIVGAMGEVLETVPVRWSSPGAKMERLPLPAGYVEGQADGIAENGTVVGSISKGGTDVPTAYLWPPGGAGYAMPLPTVKGVKASGFWAESINDGWVAGRAVFEEDGKRGSRRFESLRYRIADRTYQSLPVNSYPALLADNGWILMGPQAGPVVIAGSGVTELPRYARLKEYVISSFSADGRVAAGYTTDLDDEGVGNEPLLWTCR
ncbi:hypothetical protein QLQ12_06040 [Actinoplanes sp. NEAU-A12]|uniref:Uncharacterized protein n=1 Tax=Actinoplanes sandaracinus TaxID=3045177 RepID=A0ABT6WEN3_9ACTN|nr:hypothetical protein [Actinoplanes sandaracinus]MDI6098162.1 hypothetical protein [Actinoplanes sandaracinus]